jgi:hypothetical protein
MKVPPFGFKVWLSEVVKDGAPLRDNTIDPHDQRMKDEGATPGSVMLATLLGLSPRGVLWLITR